MRAIAGAVAIAPNATGFSCYDPTLAERLRQAAAQAEQPAELRLREAVFNEGPAGVANAVKNLWRNIGAYTTSLFSYVFTGNPPPARTDSGEPITGRDLIALLATIGIDLGLLALAIVNPPKGESRRLSVRETLHINEAIDAAVAGAGVTRDWVRGHFVHHGRASYLVIPNLYSAATEVKDEQQRQKEARWALAMNQLAGVLSDMELVRWPDRGIWRRLQNIPLLWKSELQRLKYEESRKSDTDLSELHKTWHEERHADGKEPDTIRNHGLFSKAERALEIAGWSERARKDVEVFRLVDAEGLTPLLMVLNEPGTAHRVGHEEAVATS
jgi:hypothetical protein